MTCYEEFCFNISWGIIWCSHLEEHNTNTPKVMELFLNPMHNLYTFMYNL